MAQEPSSPNWIRKGKICAVTKKALLEEPFHFSALLETDKGIIRVDVRSEAFDLWKSTLKQGEELIAWWRVQAPLKNEETQEGLKEALSFARFYDQYVQSRPDLVLRLALLLQKMKWAVVESSSQGWTIRLKDDFEDEGEWKLTSCKLSSKPSQQKEDSELIRQFFDSQAENERVLAQSKDPQ